MHSLLSLRHLGSSHDRGLDPNASAEAILSMSIPAVEGFQVAHIRGQRGTERVVVDGPSGLILGVAMAVLLDQAMEKLEQVPGRAAVAQRVLDVVIIDRIVDEMAEARPVGLCICFRRLSVSRGNGAAGLEAVTAEVVKGRPGPPQWF